MWRLAIRLKGRYNDYIYKWEYFNTYEDLIIYLGKHKPAERNRYEILLIEMYEGDLGND